MKANNVLKIMMSAAVMASMASGTVWAEEREEENGEYNEINDAADCRETETVQEEARVREIGPGVEMEDNCNDDKEAALQETGEEPVYVMMGMVDSSNVEETDLAGEQPEDVKPEEYGPHCVSLAKENEIKETAPLYTDEDLYILAHAICGEGQCCPDDEQLYIGSVILNRRSHGAYPDSIQGVVFQRGQYACTWDGNYYREPTEANWRNARWLLENGSILPDNVVYQAGFRQGSGVYLQTRYHKYCYR